MDGVQSARDQLGASLFPRETAKVLLADIGPLSERQQYLLELYKDLLRGDDDERTWMWTQNASTEELKSGLYDEWAKQCALTLTPLFIDGTTTALVEYEDEDIPLGTYLRIEDGLDDYPFAIFRANRGYLMVTGEKGECWCHTKYMWWGLSAYWAPTLGQLLQNACTEHHLALLCDHFERPSGASN